MYIISEDFVSLPLIIRLKSHQRYFTGCHLFYFFALPFVLLVAMNSVIIYTIGKRSKSNITMSEGKPQGQSQGEGQRSKSKHNEIQIYVMLQLVTFGFLILVTLAYVMLFYINFFQGTTPYFFAGYHLFYQVGEKTM